MNETQIGSAVAQDASYLLPSRSDYLYKMLLNGLRFTTNPKGNDKRLILSYSPKSKPIKTSRTLDSAQCPDTEIADTKKASGCIEIIAWNRLIRIQNIPWRTSSRYTRKAFTEEPQQFQPRMEPRSIKAPFRNDTNRVHGRTIPESYCALRAEMKKRMNSYLGGDVPIRQSDESAPRHYSKGYFTTNDTERVRASGVRMRIQQSTQSVGANHRNDVLETMRELSIQRRYLARNIMYKNRIEAEREMLLQQQRARKRKLNSSINRTPTKHYEWMHRIEARRKNMFTVRILSQPTTHGEKCTSSAHVGPDTTIRDESTRISPPIIRLMPLIAL